MSADSKKEFRPSEKSKGLVLVVGAILITSTLAGCGGGNSSNGSDEPKDPDSESIVITAQPDSISGEINQTLTIPVLQNDSISPDQTLKIHSLIQPEHGTAKIEGQQILYTPNTNYSGMDSFSYTVGDLNGKQTKQALVTIEIKPGDAQPKENYSLLLLPSTTRDASKGTYLSVAESAASKYTTIATLPDFNGDGDADLISCFSDATYIGNNAIIENAGRCVITLSNTNGLQTDEVNRVDTSKNHIQILATKKDHKLGLAVQSAGDVNGDGFSDVLVKYESNDPTINASYYLILGRTAQQNIILNEADLNGVTQIKSKLELNDIQAIGDINHDNFSDILITLSESSQNADVTVYKTYIYKGRETINSTIIGETQDDLTVSIEGPSLDLLGKKIIPLGDINQDQINDFGLSVNNYIAGSFGIIVFSGSETAYNQSQVVTHNTVVNNQQKVILLTQHAAGALSQFNVHPLGDLDKDELNDLAITSGVGTFIFYGENNSAQTTLDETYPTFTSNHSDGLGFKISGDINGDSRPDILIWDRVHRTRLNGSDTAQVGTFFVRYGEGERLQGSINTHDMPESTGASIAMYAPDSDLRLLSGKALVQPDMNGDGYDELVFAGIGEVYIIYGSKQFGLVQ